MSGKMVAAQVLQPEPNPLSHTQFELLKCSMKGLFQPDVLRVELEPSVLPGRHDN